MEKGQGKEKHAMIFIIVHSFSRATSSHLHNNAKISTKFTSLHTQTQPRFNLEPYKIASTPYPEPYHIRYTTLVLNAEPYCSVLCKLYKSHKISVQTMLK